VLPTIPLAPRLRCSSAQSSAAFSATVGTLRISTPHALATGQPWPGDYYGAGATSLASEVTVLPGSGHTPVLCQLTLIDAATRTPFWRIVGYGNGIGQSGAQAMPGGTVGDAWADPDAGRLVIPVASTEPDTDGGFLFVDLAADTVELRRGGAVLPFQGNIRQRQLGLWYATSTVSPGLNYPPAGAALRFEETRGGASLGGDLRIWSTDRGVRVYDATGDQAGALMVDADPGTDGTTRIFRTIALSPSTSASAAIVVAAQRRGDLVLAIYRSLPAFLLGGGSETTPGE
jgi:hypothetical protein